VFLQQEPFTSKFGNHVPFLLSSLGKLENSPAYVIMSTINPILINLGGIFGNWLMLLHCVY